MTNFYPQKTADELLAILDSLQKRATTGVVIQNSAAGVQTIRSFQNSGPVSVEIRRVLYSLFVLLPETYPNPYAQRITRVRPHYTIQP